MAEEIGVSSMEDDTEQEVAMATEEEGGELEDNDKSEYEVECIYDYSKEDDGTEWYYVQWKGYSFDDCTWEPKSNLRNCKAKLKKFHREQYLNYKKLQKERRLNKKKLKADNTVQQNSSEEGSASSESKAKKKKTSSDEFEVEFIVDFKRDEKGRKHYLVKWKGYSEEENTWEPKRNLVNCASKLEKFHRQKKREELLKKKLEMKRQIAEVKMNKILQSELENDKEDFGDQNPEQVKQLKAWREEINAKCTDPAKVRVQNTVDSEGPPTNFTYINECIAGPGITILNDPLIGCECSDCFECSDACCSSLSGAKFAYNCYRRVRVKPGKPIYECNKRCKCGPKCKNRVVQHGRRYKVSIFRTANGCGWGVKTLEDIRKNSFVMEYVGEVITYEEAEKRGREYDSNGRTYLFDLDYDSSQDYAFVVDAAFYGNVSHFVNHSCDPNMVVYSVWVNQVDIRMPRIALFACRDIKAGEELTFDYQMTGASSREDAEATSLEPQNGEFATPNSIPCRCGSENCRKFLF